MDKLKAKKELLRLWLKWVSFNGVPSLEYIEDCIRREYRAAKTQKISVSLSLLREMRGELILCGKIAKGLWARQIKVPTQN